MTGLISSEIISVNIEDELRQSYLDYAMSVIVGRALPDVRDGLKPVHRRVLFAMHELGNVWNKGYKKSARIVGDVVGKYHPHGDGAVYDTLVRMAQTFSLRYTLVDGQGNFGSVDGDSPAAMRYTEVRMSKLASYLLADLEKETVNFVPNYDETESIPEVLPARVPNLLINGSAGIAVGMATNIPPHNIAEVISGVIALIDNADLTIDELIQYIPGPDFPTAAIINGRAGIIQAYRTGRGKIYVRAKAEILKDASTGRETIIINEIPYQVNKAHQIEKIAELVKEKRLEGISALRDESDKDGLRMVIELKRGESGEVVLNNLYSLTQLQTVFGINMVALVDGQPRLLNLKQIMESFIIHRQEVVTRRTLFDLNKAKDRSHILEGLGIALVNIDVVIDLIKKAENPQIAKQQLLERQWFPGQVLAMLERAGLNPDSRRDQAYGLIDGQYRLSEVQVQAILDLRLHRLTGLEQEKIMDEYDEILIKIRALQDILENPELLMRLIKNELIEIKEQFGDARKTQIIESQLDLTAEDLIVDEAVVLMLSRQGYVKRQSLDNYRAQKRGGRGKSSADVKQEDIIDQLMIVNTHDTVLCFSNFGKLYWLKAYQFPDAGPAARGKPLNNMLSLAEGESVNTLLALRDFTQTAFVFLATSRGTIKKVALANFARQRANGIIAIDLSEGDYLIGAQLTFGNNDIMLFSDSGKAIRFNEADVRCMGRQASGVRGIRLKEGQKLVSMLVVDETKDVLTATARGYGKRTSLEEFNRINRGGQGVTSIKVNERNGLVVSAMLVSAEDQLMLVSDKGTLVRTRVSEISKVGRAAQGVRLIKLQAGESLVACGRIDDVEDDADVAITEVESDLPVQEEGAE
ncbi:MAG: DNA gyrase subunit A [Gammaproteobacteria bacterium]|nr:DNA gyrase subunit A [Gammaproteobacteria bacterium]